jgi:dinuclear metal center YbgI/SA1388 family protein
VTIAPRLADVVRVLDARYPPSTAEPWDKVGLVVGDPRDEVRDVLFAVDPVQDVVDEALDQGADLLVTHHPLLLSPVSSVAATSPKGAVVTALLRGGCALYVAHTNADAAERGVADALADALGLVDRRPLVPAGDGPTGAPVGLGRVGRTTEPLTLREFADRVAAALPATEQGIRVAGDLDETIRTVAVLGGSGDSLIDAVRAAGADVYVTSDLKHHAVSEAREQAFFDARARGDATSGATPFLVDTAHFASEWPWLTYAARDLVHDLEAIGTTVSTRVSTRRTDPWTSRVASTGLQNSTGTTEGHHP